MKYLSTLLAAGALTFASTAAFAETVQWDISDPNGEISSECSVDDFTMGDPIDCRGLYGGPGNNANDSLMNLNGDMFELSGGGYETGLFDDSDYGGWSDLIGKVEGGAYYDVDGTTVSVSIGDLIDDVNEFDQITMGFKQGPQISFYLFDTPLDGGEDMFKYSLLRFTSSTDLSHLSFYGRDCIANDNCDDDPGTVVPLPAAGWLLLGGVGSLVAVRRRKKA